MNCPYWAACSFMRPYQLCRIWFYGSDPTAVRCFALVLLFVYASNCIRFIIAIFFCNIYYIFLILCFFVGWRAMLLVVVRFYMIRWWARFSMTKDCSAVAITYHHTKLHHIICHKSSFKQARKRCHAMVDRSIMAINRNLTSYRYIVSVIVWSADLALDIAGRSCNNASCCSEQRQLLCNLYLMEVVWIWKITVPRKWP